MRWLIARATMVEDDVDLDEITSVVDPPHVKCCRMEVFLCEAPFHPEMQTDPGTHDDDACQACIAKLREAACPLPPHIITHFHCPVPGPFYNWLCPGPEHNT